MEFCKRGRYGLAKVGKIERERAYGTWESERTMDGGVWKRGNESGGEKRLNDGEGKEEVEVRR